MALEREGTAALMGERDTSRTVCLGEKHRTPVVLVFPK